MTDYTPANSQNSEGGAHLAQFKQYEIIIDAATTNVAAAAHALFDIPAYHTHFSTYVEALTLEGGTATIDIGVTAVDVDSLIDGADVNSATIWRSGDASTAEVLSMQGAEAGNMLLADTTFSLLANNALDTAVIRIVSIWIDQTGGLPDPT